ncbi:MAG TPA: hypothetical protein VIL18_09175 [Longimicrobiales bacterium]
MNREDARPDDRTGGETVTDAELVRYLDGEIEGAPRTALEARIAAAPDAAARLDMLRRRSTRLSALLAELDPSAEEVQQSAAAIRPAVEAGAQASRGWPWGPAALRWAAAVALLLGASAAVPPARAWMIERVRDAAEALGLLDAAPEPAVEAPTVGAQDAPQAMSVRVTFEVRADTFEIEAPPRGRLIVRRGAGSTGSAESTDATGVNLVVLPAGLRIEGATTDDARYDVVLPPSVAAVRVRAGAGAATLHALPPAGEELRIDLARP